MKILSLVGMLLLGYMAGQAKAETIVNFGPAASCPTYCTGFTTDNPAYVLNWLNPTYALTTAPRTLLSLNSAQYAGATGPVIFLAMVGTHSLYQVEGDLFDANDNPIHVKYVLEFWTTKVVSGRDAGHIVQHRMVDSGAITLP